MNELLLADLTPGSVPPALDSGIRRNEEERESEIPAVLAILPMRNLVLFPGTKAPLNIGRHDSIKLLEETLPSSKVIGIVAQRDAANDNPTAKDLYSVGTAATVLKMVRPTKDAVVAVVQGLERFRLGKVVQTEPFLRAEGEILQPVAPPADDKETEAAFRNLAESLVQLIELAPEMPEEMRVAVLNIEQAGALADFAGANVHLDVAQRQALLEELDVSNRIRAAQERVSTQLEIARIQQKLQTDVTSKFTDMQRRALAPDASEHLRVDLPPTPAQPKPNERERDQCRSQSNRPSDQ
jgi:ATP-dependent Lon protease